MNYEQQETDIVGALNIVPEITSRSDCMLIPEDVSDYKSPTQRKGLVTVMFTGEKYDSNQAVGDVSQPVTVTFGISVQARLLRGPNGVYSLCNLIKDTLLGFSPTDCGPLTLSEHTFSGYDKELGIWEHLIVASCTSLRTQNNSTSPSWEDITGGEEIFYDPTKLTIDEKIRIPGQDPDCGCG